MPTPKSLDEQTLSMSWSEVMSSDVIAISAVAKDFIVRLLGVGLTSHSVAPSRLPDCPVYQ